MDLKRWLVRWVPALLIAIAFAAFPLVTPVQAALPPGNAVKDPAAILRNALPIEQSDLQRLQHRLESTSDDLRAKRWSALANTVKRSQSLLSTRADAIVASLPDAKQAEGQSLITTLQAQVETLVASSESSDPRPLPGRSTRSPEHHRGAGGPAGG